MEIGTYVAQIYPYIQIVAYAGMILLAIFAIMYYVLVIKPRRTWVVEIHEQKADGKLHSIARDKIIEKKINAGKTTFYWLHKARQEVIPPIPDVTDRMNGKEECDYLRVEREFIPAQKKLTVNYNHIPKEQKNKLVQIHDKILKNIKDVKTTLFTSDPVHNKFIYIPLQKTLTAKMEISPIPYDMNMLMVNQIAQVKEQFKNAGFWEKYGNMVIWGLTIIFLIVLVVMTFDYVQGVVQTVMGTATENADILEKILNSAGGGKPPE